MPNLMFLYTFLKEDATASQNLQAYADIAIDVILILVNY
tara:strand:+ start:277 stop:393 length:117 start_codon:yes stop_codon:yes gene_type:complete